mmetsp:Transcript_76690/g.222661  ORF Transcript_76690/g.222661 Transcript_76690/m.222661 type:complete len:333 (-) Transcript_76690:33-1031(-)
MLGFLRFVFLPLALVAIPGDVGAERTVLANHPFAPPRTVQRALWRLVPGGDRRHRRWRPRTLAALMAAASPWRAGAHTSFQDAFKELDVDGDGLLVPQEFMGSASATNEFSNIFAQADVDDDDRMSFPEFLFAAYLQRYSAYEAWLQEVHHLLSPGLLEGIDSIFSAIRASAKDGHSRFEDLVVGFNHGRPLEENILHRAESSDLRRLFELADITHDGLLNLNELDFFYLISQERLVENVLAERRARELSGPYPVPPSLRADLFSDFDADGDGELQMQEVGEGLHKYMLVVGPSWEEVVTRLCEKSDVNGDGSLDKAEFGRLVAILMGWSAS